MSFYKENNRLLQQALEDGRVSSYLEILKLSDNEAYEHSIDVATLTALCLNEMDKVLECEYTEEECIEIIKGALLHDIGKAFLPFGIQHSSQKMNIYSREVIKSHTLLGFISVKESSFSDIIKNIIYLHHANADGTGYPINIENDEKYTEENVPSYVWIVSYADRFNAMTGARRFKNSMTYKEAWDELNDLRINGKLPYKYASYYHKAIHKLDIFNGDY